MGSARQLALVPASAARRRPWPSPIDALVDELCAAERRPYLRAGERRPDVARHRRHARAQARARAAAGASASLRARLRVCAAGLAAGRGRARQRRRPPARGARALAAARPADRRLRLGPAGRGRARTRPARARFRRRAAWSCSSSWAAPAERISESTADAWGEQAGRGAARRRVRVPRYGLPRGCRARPACPDDAFEHDGQITKRAVRALTLAALAPAPGQLLWDIGAGSGSIGIEWLRSEPTARAIAVEARAERAERAAAQCPRARRTRARDPRSARRPPRSPASTAPDAIFVGGGLTEAGLLDALLEVAAARRASRRQCRDARERAGARRARVRSAGESSCASRSATRSRSAAFTTWRPQLPIVQWSVRKEPA